MLIFHSYVKLPEGSNLARFGSYHFGISPHRHRRPEITRTVPDFLVDILLGRTRRTYEHNLYTVRETNENSTNSA